MTIRAENVSARRNRTSKLSAGSARPWKGKPAQVWVTVTRAHDWTIAGWSQFSFTLPSRGQICRGEGYVESRCHHSRGKSIWLKPGSLRSSQYALLLTHVSLSDFLSTQHKPLNDRCIWNEDHVKNYQLLGKCTAFNTTTLHRAQRKWGGRICVILPPKWI